MFWGHSFKTFLFVIDVAMKKARAFVPRIFQATQNFLGRSLSQPKWRNLWCLAPNLLKSNIREYIGIVWQWLPGTNTLAYSTPKSVMFYQV